MTSAVTGSSIRVGDVRERAVRLFEGGAPGVLPSSYATGDVGKVNCKFLLSLSSVELMLKADGRDPAEVPVPDLLDCLPTWRARQRRRGLAWGGGLLAVAGAGIGAVALSVRTLDAASFAGQALGVGGMIGGLIGFAVCVTMATEALGELRNLRRVEEHLPSWAATLEEERRRELRAQIPVPLPGGAPPGHISDDAGTVTVGEVRLPKNGRVARVGAWWPGAARA